MDIAAQLKDIRNDPAARLLIVGLGISGIETAKFCARSGIKFVAIEKQDESAFFKTSKHSEDIEFIAKKGELHFGIDGERLRDKLENIRLAVLSPGVPLESPVCAVLNRHKIPFISELEMGLALIGAPMIVVTGSNGKSTTVSLIDHILRAAGVESILCGNVGLPVIAVAASLTPPNENHRLLVVEASSYQLEICRFLKPKAAALLNISENHLERHGDLNRYLRIKSKVFEKQDSEDFALINADDPRVEAIKGELKGRLLGIGRTEPGAGHYERFATIVYSPQSGLDKIVVGEEVYNLKAAKLAGLHNRYNIAATILIASVIGVASEVIQRAIVSFLPLEHRLETCGDLNGVHCINDSKSTTVAASIAAFQTIVSNLTGDSKVTLMLGGLSKAGSWDPLCKVIASQEGRLNPIVCFGKDAGLIANYCKNFGIQHVTAPNVSAGTDAAVSRSKSGDILLFSPGCSSFDEFTDFEERGRVFKNLIASRR